MITFEQSSKTYPQEEILHFAQDKFASAPTIESPNTYPKPCWFTRIPYDFQARAKAAKLSPSEKEVYLGLASHLRNKKDGERWQTIPTSIGELIEDTGYSRGTVSRAVSQLKRLGFITYQEHELKRKRIYHIRAWEWLPTKNPVNEQSCAQTSTVVCPNEHSDVPKRAPSEPIAVAPKPVIARLESEPQGVGLDIVLENNLDNLSPVTPVPEEEKTDEQVKEKRERDFADLFYEEVLDRPLRDLQKRRHINRECKRLIGEIASDSRVESIDAAREILIDAFQRVKGYAPYSFGIMSADYGERSIEWAIEKYHDRVNLPQGTSDSSDETNAPQPSREEVDAALLEAWSDERWQEWAAGHVADLMKVRQMLVDKGFGFEPYTEAEIASMRTQFTMPVTDEEKLDWLRNRVDDHAERREVHKPLDRKPTQAIPENPDERLARLKARGVQVEDSQSHRIHFSLKEMLQGLSQAEAMGG